MSSDGFGMTRRELERELAWLLRNPPADSRELSKLFATAIVTLIDKNNARIAEQMPDADAGGAGEGY